MSVSPDLDSTANTGTEPSTLQDDPLISSQTTKVIDSQQNASNDEFLTVETSSDRQLQPTSFSALSGVEWRKWLVLALIALNWFAGYFAGNTIAVMNTQMPVYLDVSYDSWQYQFSILYAVNALPNVVLPIFGGYFADRLGDRIALVVFQIIWLLGQVLFSVGVFANFLRGVGNEPLTVVQLALLSKFFASGKLSFALAFIVSIGRSGIAVSDQVVPSIVSSSVQAAAWTATFVTVGAFACSMAVVTVIKTPPNAQTREGASALIALPLDSHEPFDSEARDGGQVACTDDDSAAPDDTTSSAAEAGTEMVPLHDGSGQASEAQSAADLASDSECHDANSPTSSSLSQSPSNGNHDGNDRSPLQPPRAASVRFADIRLWPRAFWMLCVTIPTIYGSINPWHNVAYDFLTEKWYPGDEVTAGRMMAIPDTIAAVGAPFFGLLVDKFGYRGYVMLACALTLSAVHFSFAFAPSSSSPAPELAFLGLAYTAYAASMWPSLSRFVEEKHIGMAYGITQAAVIPLCVSAVLTAPGSSFFFVELFFALLALCGAVSCIVLNVWSKRDHNDCLNVPSARVVKP